ncbi:MAG: hypothetical protein HYY40_13425 [Bacteroidetes bacterium]|nr:hypothetical protein [Bacteroidota bacterium]
MKTIILFSGLFFFTAVTFGQDVKKDDHQQQNPQYCCVKKDYCGEKAKKCPNDSQPLIKDGMYYCPQCYHKGKKPGMCGKCDVALVKMEKKS